MSDELSLVIQNLLKLFNFTLNSLGQKFEIFEAQGTVVKLLLNERDLLLSFHISVLSFDNVLVYAVVYVVEDFISALRLVKNYFQLSAPLLQLLNHCFLNEHLFAVLNL